MISLIDVAEPFVRGVRFGRRGRRTIVRHASLQRQWISLGQEFQWSWIVVMPAAERPVQQGGIEPLFRAARASVVVRVRFSGAVDILNPC